MEEKHLLVSTPQAISIETAKVSVTTEREKVTDWEQQTALAFSPSSGPLGGGTQLLTHVKSTHC